MLISEASPARPRQPATPLPTCSPTPASSTTSPPCCAARLKDSLPRCALRNGQWVGLRSATYAFAARWKGRSGGALRALVGLILLRRETNPTYLVAEPCREAITTPASTST